MYDAQAQAKGYVFGDQAEQPALLGGDAATFAPEETDDFCGEKLRWCGEVIPSPSRAKRHRAGWLGAASTARRSSRGLFHTACSSVLSPTTRAGDVRRP